MLHGNRLGMSCHQCIPKTSDSISCSLRMQSTKQQVAASSLPARRIVMIVGVMIVVVAVAVVVLHRFIDHWEFTSFL